MKLIFKYNREKDIWCILNKGKSSNNSSVPTKVYQQLIEDYGEKPTSAEVSTFIDKYISENIKLDEYLENVQKDWKIVSEEYNNRAEAIFEVSLTETIEVYLTINNRCPYSIKNNSFYVSLQNMTAMKTIMHELWHFYTWYGLGEDQEEKLGKQKYNDLKEALTVLLNVECFDLLGQGVEDMGYLQHAELRSKIVQFWKKDKNIKNLWEYLVALEVPISL